MAVRISMQFFGGRGGASGISAKGGGGNAPQYKEFFDVGTDGKKYTIVEKEQVPIKYSEYMKEQYKYETVKGSYNAKDKTIDIIQKKGEKANLEQFRKDYNVVNEKEIGNKNIFLVKAKSDRNDSYVVGYMQNNSSNSPGSFYTNKTSPSLKEAQEVYKRRVEKSQASFERKIKK